MARTILLFHTISARPDACKDEKGPREGLKRPRDTSKVCADISSESLCVYYYRTYYKAVRVGEEESGGHVL